MTKKQKTRPKPSSQRAPRKKTRAKSLKSVRSVKKNSKAATFVAALEKKPTSIYGGKARYVSGLVGDERAIFEATMKAIEDGRLDHISVSAIQRSLCDVLEIGPTRHQLRRELDDRKLRLVQ